MRRWRCTRLSTASPRRCSAACCRSCRPSGQVEALAGGDSILIGAPMPVDHNQAVQRVDAGSTLLLFTDGLVEVPGRAIDDNMQELIATLADDHVGGDLDELCDRVLEMTTHRERRDDIALLAIRILPTGAVVSSREPDDARVTVDAPVE